MSVTVHSVDELIGLAGTDLGYSEWVAVDQTRVDQFADATDDHQWIHVDPERAAAGPFGGPILHGYLTLGLVPGLLPQLLDVQGVSMSVNYGCNKVRFPAPVPVGSELRMGVKVAGVEEVAGGAQVELDVVLEVRNAPKPSCVAQVVYRFYR